ncbi:DegV family protein [Ectobacillus sp. sgz5001026]|uniref:DegV family protein n=1 Tax=Ectobacillus sp. sgz5001026 TaxID=3242473 RepID=UPI0036D26884
MTVKIITDSASDLPKELATQYNIEVLPLRVYDQDENEYIDGVTLDSYELFRNMREGKVYKTSLPSYETIHQVFSDYAKNGISCIYIAFSSELSGTYQSAQLVKTDVKENYPDFDLHIVDTKCASMGQGIVAIRAAQLSKEGNSAEDIIPIVNKLAFSMEHIFTVDDLQYLVRGGRVSRVAGFIGGLLNIKPLLHVESGKLIPLEKLRGRKKVFHRMVEIMEQRGENLINQTIGISHGDDIESATLLKNMIHEKFGCNDFVISTIGAAVGAHSGPGTLALFFLNKKNN